MVLLIWSAGGTQTGMWLPLGHCAAFAELGTSPECWLSRYGCGPHCCPQCDPSNLVLHLTLAQPGALVPAVPCCRLAHQRPVPCPHEVLHLLHWFDSLSVSGATAPISPSPVFPSDSLPLSLDHHSIALSSHFHLTHRNLNFFFFCFLLCKNEWLPPQAFLYFTRQLVSKSVYPQVESDNFTDFAFPCENIRQVSFPLIVPRRSF